MLHDDDGMVSHNSNDTNTIGKIAKILREVLEECFVRKSSQKVNYSGPH